MGISMSETERGRTDRATTPSERIATALRERIAAGELAAGANLPTMEQLQAEFGGAKATVTRALSRLRSEGLVESRPGKSMEVVQSKAAVSPAAQFDRVFRTGKIRLPNEQTVVLQIGDTAADRLNPTIREALELTSDSPAVLHRKRLVRRDDKPEFLATSYIPTVYFSARKGWIEIEDRLRSYDRIGQSTFALLAEFLDEEVEREDHTASAGAASVEEARELALNPGSPILRVTVGMFAESGTPLEVGVYSYAPGVRVSFPPSVARR